MVLVALIFSFVLKCTSRRNCLVCAIARGRAGQSNNRKSLVLLDRELLVHLLYLTLQFLVLSHQLRKVLIEQIQILPTLHLILTLIVTIGRLVPWKATTFGEFGLTTDLSSARVDGSTAADAIDLDGL